MRHFLVELEATPGRGVVELPLLDSSLDRRLQPLDQFGPAETDIVEHVGHGISLDQRLDHDIAFVGEVDVHGVRVSEQVVQVAQDFLVGADEECPEHVGRVIEGMQQQRAFDVPPIDEVIDLAIRVARDVGQHRRAWAAGRAGESA